MESLQNVKKRLKSVKNINQITKAMELVAATKMRRSQEIALASLPYALVVLDLLANISRLEGKLPLLLQKREVKKTLYILVSSDKGLAGSFNSSVFRKFEQFCAKKSILGNNSIFLPIGEKSVNYLQKKGLNFKEKFSRVGDFTTTNEVDPIVKLLIGGYLREEWDSAYIFSSHFRSALRQEPLMRKILPIDFESVKRAVKDIIPETGRFADILKENKIDFARENLKIQEYLIEPSFDEVLENLVGHLFFMQIYHLILEANASEHAARRFAMKAASDNALDLGLNLALQYNKSRQSAITREIIEITTGANAS
jgi:F-type H+-transporting ATPase subunit gamma